MIRHLGRAAAVIVVLLGLLPVGTAHAQASATWVSGVGDDANPCSRTAPCKTFAGAISKTAAGGEIRVVDPGNFGALTITKALTIVGTGTSSLAESSAGSIIRVVAPITQSVTLRDIAIQGDGTALAGVRFESGQSLTLQNVSIVGATVGVSVTNPVSYTLLADGLAVGGTTTAVAAQRTAGRAFTSIANANLASNGNGVSATNGAIVTLKSSSVSGSSGVALNAETGGAVIDADGNTLAGNGTAVRAGPGGTVRITNNLIVENTTGIDLAGGPVATWLTNKVAGNQTSGTPNIFLVPRPTGLSTLGPSSGRYKDTIQVSVSLADLVLGGTIAGQPVTFTLGSQTAVGVTDANGVAQATILVNDPPPATTLSAAFGGNSTVGPATISIPFTVLPELPPVTPNPPAASQLTYNGPAVATAGFVVSLSGGLRDGGGAPISGRTIAFTLGPNAAYGCTAVTGGDGVASCPVGPVVGSLGTLPITLAFAGDPTYAAASATARLFLSLTPIDPGGIPGGGPAGPGGPVAIGPTVLFAGTVLVQSAG